MTEPSRLPERLDAAADEIARALVERHLAGRPELLERYGASGRERCLEDARFHMAYLERALALETPSIFVDYVLWGREVLDGRGIPVDDLRENLSHLDELLGERLGEEAEPARRLVRTGLAVLEEEHREPEGFLRGEDELTELAREYLDLLLSGERREAADRIVAAADSGVPVRDLYLGVFQPVQWEVGRLWQLNRISVAHEHYCTAATQLVMSRLYPRLFTGAVLDRARMVASCAPGELHEIGVRMIADFFEMDGWDSYYVGANTPRDHLLALLEEKEPRLLALSASLPIHTRQLGAIIEALRGREALRDIHVLVGGRSFQERPELAERIGADSVAADADEALRIARTLVPGGAP